MKTFFEYLCYWCSLHVHENTKCWFLGTFTFYTKHQSGVLVWLIQDIDWRTRCVRVQGVTRSEAQMVSWAVDTIDHRPICYHRHLLMWRLFVYLSITCYCSNCGFEVKLELKYFNKMVNMCAAWFASAFSCRVCLSFCFGSVHCLCSALWIMGVCYSALILLYTATDPGSQLTLKWNLPALDINDYEILSVGLIQEQP